ncbi:MAG: CoA-binding protein [Candidatus Helarchaeota archaeon]
MDLERYMRKLFMPQSIAIIEAASKRGWQVKGITEHGFPGRLYLVSKTEEEVEGIPCYHDISELPGAIDHAIIVIKRDKLKDLISQCIAKKFHTLHIFTAGGAEYDEKGAEIEREIHNLIKKHLVRAIGPNCMGVYSPNGHFSYSPEFADKAGTMAFVSQSGDLTSQFVNRANSNGVFFSKVASIGNSIDLTLSDFITYFNADDATDTIGVYFEGFPRFDENEGKNFWSALKNVRKPLLLLRGGVSNRGKVAAASHTGTIASDNRIWNAVYKQTMALEVETFEELIDSAIAFRFCKGLYPPVKSVVIVTWSGGKAVITTDQIIQLSIEVPELALETQKQMREMISIGSVKNPLDLPWIARREKFSELVKIAVHENYIGGCIMEAGTWGRLDDKFLDYFNNICRMHLACKEVRKPFLVALPHSKLYENREKIKNRLLNTGIPVFPTILRAGKAFLNLYEFQRKAATFR